MHPRHPDLDYVAYRVGMASFKQASKYVGRDQTTAYAVGVDGLSKRLSTSKRWKEAQLCRERRP